MIDNFHDLPLGLYQRIIDASNGAADGAERTTSVLAILSGMTVDDILDLPLADYRKMADCALFLMGAVPVPPLRTSYQCGRFRLVPKLKLEDMTAGQYIDFQTFAKDDRDVEMLSCLMIPADCHYCDGYDILDVQAAIRESLATDDAMALKSFFIRESLASIAATLCSSKERRQMTLRDRRTLRRAAWTLRHSRNGGLGWLSPMLWQRLTDALGRTL